MKRKSIKTKSGVEIVINPTAEELRRSEFSAKAHAEAEQMEKDGLITIHLDDMGQEIWELTPKGWEEARKLHKLS